MFWGHKRPWKYCLVPNWDLYCVKTSPLIQPAKKIHPFASVWYEIGVLWPNIKPVGCMGFELGWVGKFLCDLQISPQIFLQPLDLKECTVPHLKDLIHICLEPEAQGCGITFNRFYVGSKYPYFIPYRGKWLYLFCRGCS